MKRLSVLLALVLAALPLPSALASAASAYVVGHWQLQDTFVEFDGARALVTDNTEFIFLNPTDLTLTLEYAFFAEDGTFCGCDRDTLKPNGRVRYTMVGEEHGGQFSRIRCPTQSDGELKSIVFLPSKEPERGKEPEHEIEIGGALQAGFQIQYFGGESDKRMEADLQAVPLTPTTLREVHKIHAQCQAFIKP